MGDAVTKALAVAINPGIVLSTALGAKGAEEGVKAIDKVTGAKDARDEANRIAQAGLDKQDALVKKQEDELAQQKLDTEAIATRDAARRRQKQKMSGGISSTILTSPLGLNGTPGVSGKTLLGE